VLEFLGRLDGQVKLRGYRIELGEIETVLAEHPDVKAVVVALQTSRDGDKRLTAFMVGGDGATPTPQSLRRWLAARLPDYMVPSGFVFLDALPLGPNGKVDREALARMPRTGHEATADYVAPRDELERSLTRIWEEVLDTLPVGVHDHFLELGGHSLKALSLVARLGKLLGRDVPLRWIFEHGTVAALAERIKSAGLAGEAEEPAQLAGRRRPLPLSFGQQRLWLLQETLPDPATYNVPAVFRLRGPVDAGRLRACLRAVRARHEVLRTALVGRGEGLAQQVLTIGQAALAWRDLDLRKVSPPRQDAALARALKAEARRPFKLSQAPLWRVLWIVLAGDVRVLAFTFHHCLIDEWSLRLLFSELEALYAAGGDAAAAAGLPGLPVQYADYAVWERRRLTGEFLRRHEAYWREQLQDLLAAGCLPAGAQRPAQRTGRGATFRFRLSGEVPRSLRALAKAEGTSLFATLLAAFQVWLHRCSGQEDVVVGTPVAHRPRLEFQSLVGFCLNTVPVRTRLEGTPGFRQVLARVRETVLDALEHAALPFERIVELAPRGPGRSQTPLHEVMFVMLEEGRWNWRLGSVRPEPLAVDTGTSKQDLMLSLQVEGDEWDCEIEYATDLFDAAAVERMAAQWRELLRSIVAQPDAPIGHLNLLPDEERQRVLREWAQTARVYPRDSGVQALFEEQARRRPGAEAVVAGGERLGYAELNRRANRLARRLRELGVEPGTAVALHLERSFEFVVAALAVLKAGGAYVPLAPEYPRARLRYLLADSGARVVLGRGPPPAGLIEANSAWLDLGAEAARIQALADEDLGWQGTGAAVAYVMYTSGSTGRPKGVAVPHRAVVRLVRGQDYAEFGPGQRFLLLAPVAFDASTFELWGPLSNGGTCVVYPGGPLDLARLEEVIRAERITCLWLTAGLFNQVVDQRPGVLGAVKHVLTGGETLSPAHVARARARWPGLKLTNGYGPTEGTTFTCTHRIERVDGPVPIGRPLANTRCYVLDEAGAPVPVGVAGELYIGGDGLAVGYVNDAALTAAKFVPDRFSGEAGGRLYRSGDRVRWRADGVLEFLGRLDGQVKLRGYRIELGEVEFHVQQHPAVAACAAAVVDGGPAGKQLVAYVVPAADAAEGRSSSSGVTLETHVRAWLKERLPAHLIPSRVVVLPALPLGPNGKVDRRQLPAPPLEPEPAEGASASPTTPLERQLAAIWEELLQRRGLGVADDFFELGGHSLLAIQVLSRVQRETGVNFPLRRFFEAPTIRALAQGIQAATREHGTSLAPAAPVTESGPVVFLIGWYLDLETLGLDPRRHRVIPFPEFEKSPEQCRVEFLAEACLRSLRAMQPRGPYVLAGYSIAGLVAFEMARRLAAAGERVPLVAVIDTRPAGWIRRLGPAVAGGLGARLGLSFRKQLVLARSWLYAVQIARGLASAGSRERLPRLDIGWKRAKELWKRPEKTEAAPAPELGELQNGETRSDLARAPVGLFWAYWWIHSGYRPRPYDGTVALFTSEELVRERPQPGRGWAPWARSLREYVIPGTHLSCLTHPDRVLAAKFGECLAALEQEQLK
jgi:amino acid adenylation domain-containing protein